MIPITSIVYLEDKTWKFTWMEGSPPYRVVLFGRLVSTVYDKEYIYDGVSFLSYPPPIEVVLSDRMAESELYTPFIKIQWYGNTSVSSYEVQEYLDTSWSSRVVLQEIGSFIYSMSTPRLVDGVSYLYRVLSFNSIGDQSTGVEFDVDMVCHPFMDDASVTISYNNTSQEIVIEETA